MHKVSYPRPAEDTWANYIYSQMDGRPVCPYSGEPYQLLTGVLDYSMGDVIYSQDY